MRKAPAIPLTTNNVWARERVVAGNVVRQLLVPSGTLRVLDDGELRVANNHGSWPASRTDGLDPAGPLTAVVPRLVTERGRVKWCGGRELLLPAEVTVSYDQAIGFRRPDEPGSLRRPQLGALHSVLGYWTSGITEPGIVVMPTGTGKTETMLALLVAARIDRLLVIVPTAALREQIAKKFEGLGVLQRYGIVVPSALRPAVGRLEHGIADPLEAEHFAVASNVVVATPMALDKCTPGALEALFRGFTHLMVDEAHHAPAPSWARIIDAFLPRPVLLFTATPYREDGRSLPGRIIFRFPLREAQAEGYFTRIDYRAVLTLEGTDATIADLAVARLRADLDQGFDHILMARARSVAGAERLLETYAARAGDLGPRVIHDRLTSAKRSAVFKALADRTCRVVICVDMLGEGFDLPQLKIAALHDVKKSLGPMIQFIGRFTRAAAESKIGPASVFVVRDPTLAYSPLRDLLREDADWNLLLHDITERATGAVEEVSAFENSFSGAPEDVPTGLLAPTMSAVAHLAPSASWAPERAVEVYKADQMIGAGVAQGADGAVAWFVLEHDRQPPWGDIPGLIQRTYELVVMYFDQGRRLLYIHGSEKNGNYGDLAEAVLGDSKAIKGLKTFRVLAGVDRPIPTNVGLLDARDHFNRFSMHVGSDVVEALDTADRHGKTQTHISTTGFADGERNTISAALSGRFWSTRQAPNLHAWVRWCDQQGAKLVDDSIDLQRVFEGFILPVDLTERPPHVLIGLEWPWQIVGGLTPGVDVRHAGTVHSLLDIDFEVDDYGTDGPFRFSLVTADWRLPYTAEFGADGLMYAPVDADAQVASRPGEIPLRTWVNKNKPTLFLEGDRMITPADRLLQPRTDLHPFDRSRFKTLDWRGVNMRVESQGAERRADSVQAFMSAHLQSAQAFDVLLDDDRAGEAADLVGITVVGTELHVTLVHCKYSARETAGARLGDLYELCGQAVRGAKWRQQGAQPLLYHLDRRAQRYRELFGRSPYEVGDINRLYRIREQAPTLRPRFHTVLAQPGLSAAAATDEHLRLLAGAEAYVRAVTRGAFEVYCSP